MFGEPTLGRHRPPPTAAAAAPTAVPPDDEVRRVYQPVEILRPDGGWCLGRINAWWTSPAGVRLCRLRVLGAPRTASGAAQGVWTVFDPERIVFLPSNY